jgi:hypothetical protein
VEDPAKRTALERLDPFVGEWTMEATPPGGPPWEGDARVTFEWLEGRTFLIQRWTVDLPEAPDGIAIIGLGDSSDAYRQHYFDSRGVSRIYEMTLSEGVWTLSRCGRLLAALQGHIRGRRQEDRRPLGEIG